VNPGNQGGLPLACSVIYPNSSGRFAEERRRSRLTVIFDSADEKIAALGWVTKDLGLDGITNQRKEYDSSMDARAEIVTETKMNEGRYSYTFRLRAVQNAFHILRRQTRW